MSRQARDALAALDRRLRAEAAKGAREASDLLADRVRRSAPVRTGKLRASVKVIVGKATPRGVSCTVVVSGGHGTPMVGDVEYGNLQQSPHPFFRPAVASSKGEMTAIVARSVDPTP